MTIMSGSKNWKGPPVDQGGGGGDNSGMESRIAKLESIAEKTSDRLGLLEKDVAIIKNNLDSFKQESFRAFATKADVSEAKNSIIMWVVSAVLFAQLLPSLLKRFGL
jgi:hypothetical protein